MIKNSLILNYIICSTQNILLEDLGTSEELLPFLNEFITNLSPQTSLATKERMQFLPKLSSDGNKTKHAFQIKKN